MEYFLTLLLLSYFSHEAERLLSGVIFRGALGWIMATLGGSLDDRPSTSDDHTFSIASPEKIRELLSEGISSPDVGCNRCTLHF